ncbi:hypothetical protein PHYBOEH_003688 [Phytophthora boehmeriae]|uniref:Protein kinase domain-containing protein n=1 Tax=Phytophthora boehmeriae TaxID=109152 RepID=A0A8T1WNL0_9STRA|nr:hypothetical protein PHYBOEH_003688 [Phytophthora boehmeriae]
MRLGGRRILGAVLGVVAMTARPVSTLDVSCTGEMATISVSGDSFWYNCTTSTPQNSQENLPEEVNVDAANVMLVFYTESSIATMTLTGQTFNSSLDFQDLDKLTNLILENVTFETGDVHLTLPRAITSLHIKNTSLTDLSLSSAPDTLTIIDLNGTAFRQIPMFLYEKKYARNTIIWANLSSVTESTTLNDTELENLQENVKTHFDRPWAKYYSDNVCNTTSPEDVRLSCGSSTNSSTNGPTGDQDTSSQTSSGSTIEESGTSSSGGLSTGALVAIIVVIIVVVLALAFFTMRVYFKRKAANAGPQNEASATLMSKGDASGDKGSFISNDEFLRNFRLPQSDVALVKSLGTGRLWMGEYNDEKVIVKRVESEVSDSYVTKALMAQARTFATISHVNITSLVGVTWLAGTDFAVVAEYMDKGNLKSVLANVDVNLDVSTKLQMCLDVAQALAYLHETEQNLSAKQLSSRKVLVNKAMSCKISIFECVPSSTKLGGPGYMSTYSYGMGEVAWLPPEVITRSSPMDARKNNIYAFGVLVSEIFTRVSPYQTLVHEQGNTMSDVELVKRVRRQDPMVPHENRREYLEAPASVRLLVEQCLSYAPMSRPTALDLVNCLRGAKEELQTNSI